MQVNPRQQYARVGPRIVDVEKLSDTELITMLQGDSETPPRCLICHHVLDLRSDDGEHWRFVHQSDDAPLHEPETPEHYRARHLMLHRLKTLFPSATIAEGAPLADRAIDCLLVTNRGGRLAVEIECEPMSGEQWRARRDALLKEGIITLWILGSEQLPYKTYKKRPTVSMKLNDLHCAMLADGEHLWMLDHASGYLVRIIPRPEVMELIGFGMKRINYQVECAIRRYPLSQLRMRAGSAEVLTRFDPPMPEFGPLQKRLADKIIQLRASHAIARSHLLGD